jgi:DNA-directed RNA polymerase specialized sigma24 family protein
VSDARDRPAHPARSGRVGPARGQRALPERQRLALFLRYYADLDYEAIADALGVKAGTIAATLHAAHAALRRELLEVKR